MRACHAGSSGPARTSWRTNHYRSSKSPCREGYISGRKYLPPDTLAEGVEERESSSLDARIVLVLGLVFLMTVAFLVTAGQLGNVYTLWLLDRVDRHVLGFEIPVTWFQSFTPLVSLLVTPLIIRAWSRQADRGVEPTLFAKMALGLTMSAIGMFALAFLSEQQGVAWWAVLPTHVLICLAYIFIYPVGLAVFSVVAPSQSRAMFIGIFYITSFVAANLVGFLGGYYVTISSFAFWALHGALGAAAAVVAFVAVRPLATVLSDRERSPPLGESRHA
jgi:proton-dependent oligopeptide transporter, POT family